MDTEPWGNLPSIDPGNSSNAVSAHCDIIHNQEYRPVYFSLPPTLPFFYRRADGLGSRIQVLIDFEGCLARPPKQRHSANYFRYYISDGTSGSSTDFVQTAEESNISPSSTLLHKPQHLFDQEHYFYPSIKPTGMNDKYKPDTKIFSPPTTPARNPTSTFHNDQFS